MTNSSSMTHGRSNHHHPSWHNILTERVTVRTSFAFPPWPNTLRESPLQSPSISSKEPHLADKVPIIKGESCQILSSSCPPPPTHTYCFMLHVVNFRFGLLPIKEVGVFTTCLSSFKITRLTRWGILQHRANIPPHSSFMALNICSGFNKSWHFDMMHNSAFSLPLTS